MCTAGFAGSSEQVNAGLRLPAASAPVYRTQRLLAGSRIEVANLGADLARLEDTRAGRVQEIQDHHPERTGLTAGVAQDSVSVDRRPGGSVPGEPGDVVDADPGWGLTWLLYPGSGDALVGRRMVGS